METQRKENQRREELPCYQHSEVCIADRMGLQLCNYGDQIIQWKWQLGQVENQQC